MRITHQALYFVFVTLLASPLAIAKNTSQHSVPLEGCPKQLELTIPQEFSRADTPAKLKLRTTIIDALHANKMRKARYSEIFLANWQSENGLPYISVSSLGSLIRSQGRITESDWRKIRDEFSKSTMATRQTIIEKQILQYNAQSVIDAKIIRAEFPALFEDGDTAIVMVGSVASAIKGRTQNILTATKLVYVHKCIASVQIAMDSTEPDALKMLNRYMAQVIIK